MKKIFQSFNFSIFQSGKARSGLTMIELLVVLSITVIISVTSFAAFGSISSSKSIKNGLDEVEALFTAARKKSITQENGARWGVRVENTTSTKRFALFSGLTYASGTPSNFYSPQRNVVITNPVSSSTYDVLFEPISGFLSEKKVLTIATLKKDGIIGDLVLNMIGAVTKRYDYGLAGYWHFDEGVGTNTVDATGIGNNGTLNNSPTWQASTNCKAGTCIGFDGTNDYISVLDNNALNLTSAGSVSVWLKIPSIWSGSLYPNVVGKGANAGWDTAGWSIYAFSSNQIGIGFRNGATTRSLGFSNSIKDEWTHIVGVWNGSTMNIYQNGVLKNTTAQTISPPTTAYPLTIGRDNGGQYFGGSIDEVRVYNRALSVTEILGMYNDLK
ncbi:LamG domain-containing protein [Candidatus Parcubacteria bacterium]|jgi:prepilin-type N-terminal cleavage/methylation domain-containing protein|nr:MAG: LamG domain-containing protein [Candidatus Parcubacteria bacterium]